MTALIIVLVSVIVITFVGLLYAILCGLPQETLDEQEECIRQDAAKREERKRQRNEKRRKK